MVLDGSKVKANASKHKAMSYGRMKEEEKRLKEEVKRLLEQAEATDAEEDTRYGRDKTGEELPAELGRRETRLQRIQEAKRALEERAKEEAKNKGKPEEKAKPKTKMQYNFTDPESRIMPGADGFVQAYNTQIAVDPDFQWIVGQRVTQATNDKQQLAPTVKTVEEQAGQKPQASHNRQRVLLGGQSEISGEEKDRRLHCDRPGVLSRPPAAGPAGAATPGSDAGRPYAPETADHGGSGHLLQAQNGGGAGVWTDQTSARLPAISLAWSGEGARRVGHDLSHAQHSEVTPALLWIEIETSKKGH